jgi:50S ribosomal protein L16 3-hydroxylase
LLTLPGNAEQFLARYWQKEPLYMPGALERVRPAVTRNELAWLSTLDDVESRLVFTRRGDEERIRYTAETGPFDPDYLAALPKRDWTLLVHDVEKHLPAMRRLFDHVPFVPDWRIDDLMVSFAAPGGGVGPHRDNYDVFLCQGIGSRDWYVSTENIANDTAASSDLALLSPFSGRKHETREGDALYLPPGVAHWGTATRACITYSIGMRAPQLSDLFPEWRGDESTNLFYADPDLHTDESVPGYLSPHSIARVVKLAGAGVTSEAARQSLGCFITQTKDWLSPEGATDEEAATILGISGEVLRLTVHGMARIAWDDRNIYANGAFMPRHGLESGWLERLCATRRLAVQPGNGAEQTACLGWMLQMGVFELPENS